MTEKESIILGSFIYDSLDFKPTQLDISSRRINYWITKGTLPFVELQQLKKEKVLQNDSSELKEVTSEKALWIRMNAAQAVWACVVKELLELGVPIKKLALLAETVWNKPRLDKYADKVFEVHIKSSKSGLTEKTKQLLSAQLKDEILMEHYFRTIINPFTDSIKSALTREGLPYFFVYVPKTGEHQIVMNDNNLVLNLSGRFLESPLVCIPLLPILSKVAMIDYFGPKKDLAYLTDIEKQVREIITFKRPKVVEIAYGDNSISPITVREQHKSREELAQYILKNKIAKGSKLLIDIRSKDHYKLTLIQK